MCRRLISIIINDGSLGTSRECLLCYASYADYASYLDNPTHKNICMNGVYKGPPNDSTKCQQTNQHLDCLSGKTMKPSPSTSWTLIVTITGREWLLIVPTTKGKTHAHQATLPLSMLSITTQHFSHTFQTACQWDWFQHKIQRLKMNSDHTLR